ncbi:hypothetical protein F2Q70_00021398 [Brassica cretica]|uniref:Uncharacterized protein n=1 Tax=Brassica cretica TaxID=69181 RepID=A0A8S9HR12_BRACR|nr:hypothetical protein F2Q70_00021398 [Brassica cretica]KAF2559182.1 hypothetical protein F2Q68_00014942 [Brassica cretica]
MFPRTVPSEISEEIPMNSPRKCFFGMSSESLIFGIPSELSEEIPKKFYFPTRNFRRPFSSVCPRNTVIPRTYRRYLSSEYRCFVVVMLNQNAMLGLKQIANRKNPKIHKTLNR